MVSRLSTFSTDDIVQKLLKSPKDRYYKCDCRGIDPKQLVGVLKGLDFMNETLFADIMEGNALVITSLRRGNKSAGWITKSMYSEGIYSIDLYRNTNHDLTQYFLNSDSIRVKDYYKQKFK